MGVSRLSWCRLNVVVGLLCEGGAAQIHIPIGHPFDSKLSKANFWLEISEVIPRAIIFVSGAF